MLFSIYTASADASFTQYGSLVVRPAFKHA